MITCRICGSTNLTADPAGYYEHAQTLNGAPLMCQDWNVSKESIYAHSGYAADRASQPRETRNDL